MNVALHRPPHHHHHHQQQHHQHHRRRHHEKITMLQRLYAHVRAAKDHAILSFEGLKILTTWGGQDPEYLLNTSNNNQKSRSSRNLILSACKLFTNHQAFLRLACLLDNGLLKNFTNICFAAIMAWKAFYKERIAARHACDWKPHHG